MTEKEKPWIACGYEAFALQGLPGLKIEPLARAVGVSKSSFYHHFADMEVFMERLLRYHLEQAAAMAKKEEQARSVDPELIDILLQHKADLLFNRQLRIGSDHPLFKEYLLQSSSIIGKSFIGVWLADTKSRLTWQQAEGLFDLALENFFLQINVQTLNRSWLEAYFENLKLIARSFEKPLYGSG